jgi:hypothetical protein
MESFTIMRRILKLSVLCLATVAVSACKPDEVIQTENIPTAGVRFINAVPDTQAMDFRFVDIVESNAHFRVGFRNNPVTSAGVTASTQVQYKGARAGSARRFRIFYNDTLQAVASTVLKDSTLNLTAGSNYTVLMWGYANPTGAGRPVGAQPMALFVFTETDPAGFDPATQVALRVINTSSQAVDAFYYDAATGTTPGTSIQAGIAACCSPASISSFAIAAPGTYRFYVQPAGNPALALGDGIAIQGAAAVTGAPGPFDAVPGTSVAGSAVTMLLFDPTIANTSAPTFNITTGNTNTLYGAVTPWRGGAAVGYGRLSGSWRADGFFVGQQITGASWTAGANNGVSTITAIDTASTGSASLSATATGYARPATGTGAGSFVTNGFQVGQIINVTGFSNAQNNGRSVITAVAAQALTVNKAGGTVAQGTATGRRIDAEQTITVTKATGPVLDGGTTGSTHVLSATATGYARSSGDFIAQGFIVGLPINATGFTNALNNGASTVTAVTATTLDVTKTGGTAVEPGAVTASFGASTAGYTRTIGSFITDGFLVGHTVNATGFIDSANNGGPCTVTAVTAVLLTCTKSPQTVAEVEAPGRTLTVTNQRTIANADNRSLAGVLGRIWSFVWDRRPPRPAGI